MECVWFALRSRQRGAAAAGWRWSTWGMRCVRALPLWRLVQLEVCPVAAECLARMQ